MDRYKLTLPAMGEGIIEATITRWLVSAGEKVSVDQPLLEVATDKVDSVIPSPVEGTLARLIYNEGEIPKVGEVLALIETGVDIPVMQDDHDDQPAGLIPEEVSDDVFLREVAKGNESMIPVAETQEIFISPHIRMLAQQRGIPSRELQYIRGTGLNGRITRDDLNTYLVGRIQPPVAEVAIGPKEEIPKAPEIITEQGDETVEMDRMRKIIAGHMVRSKHVSPHVTSFLEADMTPIVNWREKHKEQFLQREKVKLTFTPILVEAVAKALAEFPGINVSLSGDHIIYRKNINVGIATALPNGNLIVPVVRNADKESLASLSRKIADLAERARNNSLQLHEIKGGTFTVTNIGQYNNLTGTPIINQPESAILAIGTLLKKPWAVKTPTGYGVAVRDISMLALTYDHRIIDGALGGSFLSRVVWYLEHFDDRREC